MYNDVIYILEDISAEARVSNFIGQEDNLYSLSEDGAPFMSIKSTIISNSAKAHSIYTFDDNYLTENSIAAYIKCLKDYLGIANPDFREDLEVYHQKLYTREPTAEVNSINFFP